MHKWVATALAVLVLVGVNPTPASATGGIMPVQGAVVGSFDPPEVKWGAGHRGVDIESELGAAVVAPKAGVITFAGMVAGRPVVVVGHGDTRTTLEPVTASVPVGTSVKAGQQVGVLESGHECAVGTCLHWGLKRGEVYLDPLSGVRSPVRLLAKTQVTEVKRRTAARAIVASVAGVAGTAPTDAGGVLLRPVAGRLTSGFGQRFHPIFHEWRLHAGVDLSAPCGTPIRAAADGRVTHMGFDSSGGWRLIIAHASHGGQSLTTSYLHAQGYSVRVGAQVKRGQVVGRVGSTGWSTGCHLHFSTKLAGRQVDPTRFW